MTGDSLCCTHKMASPLDSSLVGKSCMDLSRTASPRIATLPRGLVVGLVGNVYGCMATLRSLVSAEDSVTEVGTGSLRDRCDDLNRFGCVFLFFHECSPISYRSSAERRKNAGQRLTFCR